MDILVTSRKGPTVGEAPMEIVERKGAGHPDSLCDAAAEALSVALCRYYLEHFGRILHHNVDKAVLVGGRSRAEFGGGRVTAPMRLIFAGRAATRIGKHRVPLKEIAVRVGREVLAGRLPHLDVERHLRVETQIHPGSQDLVANYDQDTLPASNDTSLGVGFAPLTETETVVAKVERHLNSPAVKRRHPEWGEDVKVMGTRVRKHLNLTVALAFVSAHTPDFAFYAESRAAAAEEVRKVARRYTGLELSVDVNRADVDEEESVYLTVTGTSAEAGDDGQVGRGNRPNGLITPYRPMTLEAAAGKNPTNHVGKIYNLAAWDIARRLAKHEGIEGVDVFLVSAIGAPVNKPRALEIRVESTLRRKEIEAAARRVADRVLREMPNLWKKVLDGRHSVC